jgi:hypothetical protein
MANYRIGEMKEICKAGAAASSRVQKDKSREKWEANRPKCLTCGPEWPWNDSVKGYYQRKRKFCNSTCSKTYYWQKKKELAEKEVQADDLGFRQKSFVRREALTKHARRQYKKSGGKDFCERCGYCTLPPEIAHVEPVSSFPGTATLFEINAPENLIGLCNRCHSEYDANVIRKEYIKELVARRLSCPGPQEVG